MQDTLDITGAGYECDCIWLYILYLRNRLFYYRTVKVCTTGRQPNFPEQFLARLILKMLAINVDSET